MGIKVGDIVERIHKSSEVYVGDLYEVIGVFGEDLKLRVKITGGRFKKQEYSNFRYYAGYFKIVKSKQLNYEVYD